MGRYDSSENSAVNLTLVAAATSAITKTPPTPMPTDTSTLTRWAMAYDFDRDAPNIFISNQEFPESAWDMYAADSMDRTQFREHGGKLLIVHGVSDPIFSINDTIRWLTALDQVEGGTAADFVRLFAVPGMNHCGGGPATDQYDAFQALVDWVEKHKAPDVILATAGPATPWPGRTRPLCHYPTVATYKGHGDIEKAENFTCE
jgi:feruloyl esterase